MDDRGLLIGTLPPPRELTDEEMEKIVEESRRSFREFSELTQSMEHIGPSIDEARQRQFNALKVPGEYFNRNEPVSHIGPEEWLKDIH